MSAIDLSQYYIKFIEQISISSAQNRLPHALLLNNIDHIELESLLCKIAGVITRKSSIDDLAASTDIFYLKSNTEQIKIDQIKSLLEEIYLTSHGAVAKVAIISPLEALNTSAANALLKSLEEPPESTYFLMTSNHLQGIMPTLRSRVQVFDIGLNHQQKRDYLFKKYQMTEEDITKALQISKADLKVIDKIKMDKNFWQLRKELIQVLSGELSPLTLSIDLTIYYQDTLYWLMSFLVDTYYHKFNRKATLMQDQTVLTERLIKRYDHVALYGYYQRLLKLKFYEGKHFNVNKQLAIESLLVELCA